MLVCDCGLCRHAGEPAAYAEGHAAARLTFPDGDAAPPRPGRRRFLAGLGGVALALAGIGTAEAAQQPTADRAPARAAARRLTLLNTHTGETFNEPILVNGRYSPAALQRLNVLMRDHHSGAIRRCDPQLFDLLSRIQMRIGRPLSLVSGYRSWATNAWLRARSNNVAEHSFHIRGMAADFYVEGVRAAGVARIAQAVGAGGVGLYRGSSFIHVDTGPRRSWYY
ncbi:MAG: DUF882 domain-containing protein [Alphaproteobacteria bacterium]|nr:DUF882 domain-containing protein [Alphaproteobacteria bacterium]